MIIIAIFFRNTRKDKEYVKIIIITYYLITYRTGMLLNGDLFVFNWILIHIYPYLLQILNNEFSSVIYYDFQYLPYRFIAAFD